MIIPTIALAVALSTPCPPIVHKQFTHKAVVGVRRKLRAPTPPKLDCANYPNAKLGQIFQPTPAPEPTFPTLVEFPPADFFIFDGPPLVYDIPPGAPFPQTNVPEPSIPFLLLAGLIVAYLYRKLTRRA
jgi:hypothetical protein